VKDYALVGQTGAEERRRKNMAIVRSHIVEQTNELAKKIQVRKRKTDENVPTGDFLTATFLDVVEEHFN